MIARLLSIIPVFLLVLSSCSDDSANTPNPIVEETLEIQPLQKGNLWIYKHSAYIQDSLFSVVYDTVRVVDSQYDSDSTQWFVVDVIQVGRRRSTVLWTNTSHGLMEKSDVTEMLCKYPATRDDMYFRASVDAAVQVVATDTLIWTPSRPFVCYLYNYEPDGAQSLISEFYCPGIGLVLQYSPSQSTSFHSVKELISYKLN
jgi:hypothetical protein